MLSYVTKGWYDRSYMGKWLYEVMGIELDKAQQIINELSSQVFVETATWGLAYHEIKWGLPVRESLSYEERRKLICRKRDERAPMNPYRMEVILKNMTGREAHVDDESGPVNTFTVEFEPGDTPIDLAAVIDRLNEIKQSHVAFWTAVVSAAAGPARAAAGASQWGWYKAPAVIESSQVMKEDAQARLYTGVMQRTWYQAPAVIESFRLTEEAVTTRLSAGVLHCAWYKAPAATDGSHLIEEDTWKRLYTGACIHSVYCRNTVKEQEGKHAAVI